MDQTLMEGAALYDGFIEVVPVPWQRAMALVVNEEGLIYDLPLNPKASRYAGQQIVGPAVLLPRRLL